MVEINPPEYDKMHIPIILRREENLDAYENDTLQLIISNYNVSSDLILNNSLEGGEFYPELKTYVDAVYLSQGINKEFISQSIKGKIVCVINGGNLSRMSCHPKWYKILDSGILGGLLTSIPEGYAKINLSFGEQTLSDLLKNSFKYYYDDATKQYQPYDEKGQEYQKYLYLNKYTSEKTRGYEFEQIENLTKILSFVLKKMDSTLTSEERKTFSSLLNQEITNKELAEISNKEKRFKEIKDKRKKN